MQRLVEMRDRLIHAAFSHERTAQVVFRLRVGRIELHCLTEVRDGFGQISLSDQRQTQVVVGRHMPGSIAMAFRYSPSASSILPYAA